MPLYLSSGENAEDDIVRDVALKLPSGEQRAADLKIFWGPDMCRLEYLVHLLDTGRIKDEYWQKQSGSEG